MSSMFRLEDILAPITISEFADVYWGKKPLYISGPRTKFQALYSLEQFLAVLDRPGSVLGNPKIHASFDKRGSTNRTPTLNISARDARTAYDAGATICMNRLDEHEPALAALATTLRTALGYPGDMHVNAYWSPDGAGFLPHFDARIATTLQIQGSKKWRYARRAEIAWPHDNAALVNGRVDYDRSGAREPWEEQVSTDALKDMVESNLQPGDLLCLPAGTIHEALADGPSFALNCTFNRLPVSVYLSAILARHFGGREEWRYVRPLSPNVGSEDHHPTATAELRARLRETIAYLQELEADPRELSTLAALELAATAVVPKEEAGPSTPLGPESEVSVSPFVVVASRLADDPLVVIVRGQKIEAAGGMAALMRRLLSARTSTATSLASSAAERPEVLGILGELETLGFLRRN